MYWILTSFVFWSFKCILFGMIWNAFGLVILCSFFHSTVYRRHWKSTLFSRRIKIFLIENKWRNNQTFGQQRNISAKNIHAPVHIIITRRTYDISYMHTILLSVVRNTFKKYYGTRCIFLISIPRTSIVIHFKNSDLMFEIGNSKSTVFESSEYPDLFLHITVLLSGYHMIPRGRIQRSRTGGKVF